VFFRGTHRAERLGRIGTRSRAITPLSWLFVLLFCGMLAACASNRGSYYTVRPGDNLYRIGLAHEVSPESIMRANRIRDVTGLRAGARIWIPDGRGGRTKRPVVRTAVSASKPSKRGPSKAASKASSSAQAKARAKQDRYYAGSRHEVRQRVKRDARLVFDWPLAKGKLVSRFGYRWGRRHKGIDLAAPSGTNIRAAEKGKVIHSGRLGSYGNVVILSHSGKYRTLYAHARKTHVKKGQMVKQGQKIAEVGSTGKSTGPHLHFEVRKGEGARDPLLFLP
jgi:lipoprotein NlpD